ncbi:hypothetical protein GKQ77_25575 [Streptomyces sp. BG9H]|uniref:Translation initiation factor IF-2 n=1 Tax=Streptomyces anatolicus TaxID=2675858 RepID=A0ABS6YTX9_9ACTN|nr:hypothetical protein [Streptomyces anatolicus]MBW5424896.1 hypothetical protein [Streptomyces anatolicus]
MGHHRTTRDAARRGTARGEGGYAGAAETVTDRNWAADVRAAILCALGLFVLITLIDLANGTLSLPRLALWAGLSALLYVVLHPARVTAGPGWLAVQGLGRRRHVCTGLLTAVRHNDGVAARLVLCDSLGNRVELDPQILVANPLLLHRLDRGARAARDAGLLNTGCAELRRLTARIDGAAARGVFEASDLR